MRITPNTASPWGRNVYYDDHEFDAIMDELRGRAGAGVFEPGRGVDVDAVLERGVGVVPNFVDLPDGVLGRTRFRPDGRFQVEISRALAEEAERDSVARRRLRSTAAHECGHGALHAHLHLADTSTYPLFNEPPKPPQARVLCRHDTVGVVGAGARGRYDGQWWEYQANRGMASLLLPRRLLAEQVKDVCTGRHHSDMGGAVCADDGQLVIRALADLFDVNPAMVFYRLQELRYLPADIKQEVLQLAD